MRRDDVQIWLDRYIAAWSSYDKTAIGDLFAEDAEYRYHPWDEETLHGREAIVESWTAEQDEPGSWAAHYDVWAFDGERASAVGESRYTNTDGSFKSLYYNHFALRFDGHGKCVEFVEYFMELPERLREGR
jgi:nuclear transport factor 2 (NTF2) superfamily protein